MMDLFLLFQTNPKTVIKKVAIGSPTVCKVVQTVHHRSICEHIQRSR